MIPLPKLRIRGATAQLRRDLLQPGDSTWLALPMRGLGSATRHAGLTGRYTARKEGDGVRVWLLEGPISRP